MTTKEAYEKIREYFSQPDAVYGMDHTIEECRYRTPEGYKCAVGCLIPDKLYDDAMEGDSIPRIQEFYNTGLEAVDTKFLELAQTRHDQCAIQHEPMSTFIEQLDELAKKFDLV